MPRFTRLALSLLLLTSAPAALAAAPLTTQAERSGFIQTGRYDEVIALCDAFAQRYPQAVRCIQFGTTPEGRPMKALIASTSGALDAQSAAQRKLPVVLIQGGIHAGEIDGKDAGFLALRELLDGKAGHGALDKLVWVFVPVFNVDGHERFGAWNRPNQRGPEQMGWRTTAQNLNLNRDYVKADAPEMQAMLQLVQQWDPLMYVDLHVTDGAKFEHDVSVQVEPVHAGDASLQRDGTRWRDAVLADLKKQGSLPLPYYPSFVHEDDPSSGFADDVSPPRFSHGYFLLRNRFGMLVETHSWKDYPTRVRINRNAIVSVLQQAARHGTQWRADALAADQRATRLAGTTEPLSFAAGPDARTVAFRGYAYTRTPSPISGALMTRYDESKPQVWKGGGTRQPAHRQLRGGKHRPSRRRRRAAALHHPARRPRHPAAPDRLAEAHAKAWRKTQRAGRRRAQDLGRFRCQGTSLDDCRGHVPRAAGSLGERAGANCPGHAAGGTVAVSARGACSNACATCAGIGPVRLPCRVRGDKKNVPGALTASRPACTIRPLSRPGGGIGRRTSFRC